MGFLALFGAIGGGLTIAIAMMLRAIRRKDERAKGMRALAAEWGLEFSALVPESSLPFARLRFFTETALGSEVEHVMQGDDLWVADVFRSDGSGSDASIDRHTVVACAVEGGDLPSFSAVPEDALDRLFQRLGSRDIDFGDDPEFSRAFELKGSPEAEVRSLFDPAVRKAAVALPRRVRFEGRGGWVLVCSPGRTPVSDLALQVESARGLAAEMCRVLSAVDTAPTLPAGSPPAA